MGWTPAEVGACSRWEFLAAAEGYGRANGWKLDEAVTPMSVERLRELEIEGF